jgi:hypothetical protein
MCKCQTPFLTIHKSKNREALIFFQKFCEDDEKTLLREPHKYADLQSCGGNLTGGGEEGRRDLVEEKTTTFLVFFLILIFNLTRVIS